MSNSITFAGVKTKLTSTGGIRRPALIKMLRSGLVTMRSTRFDPHDIGGDNSCDPVWIAADIEDSSGHSSRASGWYGSIGDSIVSGRILRIGCHSHRSYTVIEDPEASAAAAPEYARRRAWDKRARASSADGRARLFESRAKDKPEAWAASAERQREEATELEAIAVAAEAIADAFGPRPHRTDVVEVADDTAAQVAEVARVIDCLEPVESAPMPSDSSDEIDRLMLFLGL